MKTEFVEKFMSVYEKELFPNEENNYEKIKKEMESFNKTNGEEFIDFPFARQKFARLLTIFGIEIFYVWDKYIIKMYAFKVVLCVICGLLIGTQNIGLMALGCMLMMTALFIVQVIIFKKMPKICKRYNNKLLEKAIDNPNSIQSRKNYFSIVRKIFFIIRDKNFRKSVKELRDSFFIN